MSITTRILSGLAATVLLSLILTYLGPGARCGGMATASGAGGAVAACQRDVDAAALRGTIAFEGTDLAEPTAPVLDALAGAIRACTGTRMEVGGHTELGAPAEVNLAVSQRRAAAVVAALAARAIPVDRLVARGYGATRLVVRASGRDADARNRRTTFTVVAAPAARPSPSPAVTRRET